MATVTAFTAARSQQIEDDAITGARLDGDNLILEPNNAAEINVGSVRGPQGVQGPVGEVSTAAMDAAIALAIAAEHIDTAQIVDGAVTAAKLAVNAVATGNLQDAAISTAKIADGAVTTAKIADAAVTSTKLGNGQVTQGKIANNAIDTAQIADGAVDTSQLAGDCITAAKIANNAVGQEHVDFIHVQASAPTGSTGAIWIDT